MAAIYLRHPIHGCKVACGDLEASMDRSNGWKDYDPYEIKVSKPEEKPPEDTEPKDQDKLPVTPEKESEVVVETEPAMADALNVLGIPAFLIAPSAEDAAPEIAEEAIPEVIEEDILSPEAALAQNIFGVSPAPKGKKTK